MTKGKAAAGTSIIAAIILTAVTLIGTQEKPNNSGWYDAAFQKEMVAAGWHKGDSWCVYFCKVVWNKSITNDTVRTLAMKMIVGNSQSTLANFRKDTSGWFVLTDSARKGSIVIWQHMKNGVPEWSGHAGIVDSVYPAGHKYDWSSIEGNTNNNGSSNGYIVLRKDRRYNWKAVNGLRIKKFIGINLRRYGHE